MLLYIRSVPNQLISINFVMSFRKSGNNQEGCDSSKIDPPKQVQPQLIAKPTITYLQAQAFMQLISNNVDEDTYNQFAKIFRMLLRQATKQKDQLTRFHFPIVIDSNKQYLRIKIMRFAIEYTQECKNFDLDLFQQNMNKNQQSQQSSEGNIPLQDQIEPMVQENINLQAIPLYEIPQFLKKSVASDSLTSFCVSEQFINELNSSRQLVKSQIQSQQKGDLLDTYVEFIQEYLKFNAIKAGDCEKMISEEQIAQLKAFSLKEYFKNWRIRDEVQMQDNLFDNQAIFEQKKVELQRNKLLQSWMNISKQVENVMMEILEVMQLKYQSCGGLRGRVKQVILKGLDNIYLEHRHLPQIYANTCEASILININKNKSLTQQEYKKGPLLPYICLCIYHELSHLLVRQIDECNVKKYDKSFDLRKEEQSLGKILISSLIKQTGSLPSYFVLQRKSRQQQKLSIQIFKETRLQIQRLFSILSQKPQILKISLGKIKEKVSLFQGILQFQPKRCSINSRQIDQYIMSLLQVSSTQSQSKFDIIPKEHEEQMWQQWNRVKYQQQQELIKRTLQRYKTKKRQITELYSSTSEQLTKWLNQRVYRFFFSLFLTPTFARNWFKPSQLPRYQELKNKLYESKITKYFLRKNQTIEATVHAISNGSDLQKELFSSFTVDSYCIYTLNQRKSLDDFHEEIEQYCKDIKEQDLQTLITSCDKILKSGILLTFFQKFDIQGFITQKKRQRQHFYSVKNYEGRLFESKFKLKRVMGYIFMIDTYRQIFTQFMKYTEIYQILFQLPSFFTSNAIRKYESGYHTERKLFMNLQDKIYSKDHKNIQLLNLPSYRDLVGIQPIQQDQKRKYINTAREGKNRYHYIDLSNRVCGTHRLGQLIASNREKEQKVKELKMKLNKLKIQEK